MTKTIEEKYKSLSEVEHVRKRSGMYLGSKVTERSEQYILEDGKFIKKLVNYNPGVLKLFDEIISNSVDESKRKGSKLNTIKVEVNQETGYVVVYDNGGIPVEIHKETKKYLGEMLFGSLRTGSNYDDTEQRTVAGTNGIGSVLVNIMSDEFKVETADGKQRFNMTWTDHMSNHTKPNVKFSTSHYTRITYKLDFNEFEMNGIDNDCFKLIEKRVYDVAGCNPNLTIFFNGKKIMINSFRDYCEMYLDSENVLLYEENKNWQIGVSVSPIGNFQQISFVNNCYTYDGGTHNDYVLNQIIPTLREKISKKYKTDVLPGQIKNHIFLFINSTIFNPSFSSQTKEKLITDQKNFGTEIKLTDKFINSIYKSEITNSITDWLEQKKNADEKKAEREANKAIAKVKVDKLVDCKWAGGLKKSKCRLILTEGDSAMCAMRKFRDPNTDAGLALKGKSLNVRDLPKTKVMENTEIMSVMSAMGLRFGENPIVMTSSGKIIEDKTRFGEIQIYTDADVDGTCCAALILNYIHKFWPSLIKAHKIARVETPVLIAEHKKTKKETWFYYDSEYREWLDKNDINNYNIHYLKGLGSLNDKQSKEIFQNPHKYYYELDDFAEQSMIYWFGKDSEQRKKMLLK